MMFAFKHTYSRSASILRFFPRMVWAMDEIDALVTKGQRIACIIKKSGHTPASIAKLLGCAPAAVYQWIDGSTQNLKEPYLWKLADITGYEARWISTGLGQPRIDPGIKHANELLTAMEPEARYTAVRLLDTLAEPKKVRQ